MQMGCIPALVLWILAHTAAAIGQLPAFRNSQPLWAGSVECNMMGGWHDKGHRGSLRSFGRDAACMTGIAVHYAVQEPAAQQVQHSPPLLPHITVHPRAARPGEVHECIWILHIGARTSGG